MSRTAVLVMLALTAACGGSEGGTRSNDDGGSHTDYSDTVMNERYERCLAAGGEFRTESTGGWSCTEPPGGWKKNPVVSPSVGPSASPSVTPR